MRIKECPEVFLLEYRFYSHLFNAFIEETTLNKYTTKSIHRCVNPIVMMLLLWSNPNVLLWSV
jgi:hypothetical protein